MEATPCPLNSYSPWSSNGTTLDLFQQREAVILAKEILSKAQDITVEHLHFLEKQFDMLLLQSCGKLITKISLLQPSLL